MGKFTDSLVSGLGGGLASTAASGLGSIIDGIFGISRKKAQRQMEMQQQLMEKQAEIQYNYNEMAARNAFDREMQMYERSYEDQSYSAMRKQMEDAGLSVGMMYGGSGAGGQGGATTGGAPQGGTGGGAPAAPDVAAIDQAMTARRQAGLQLALGRKDLDLKDAQIDEINARAASERANARLHSEQAMTEAQIRDKTVAILKEEGRAKWLDNIIKKMSFELPTDSVEVYGHKDFGTFKPNEGSIGLRRVVAEINEAEANAARAEGQAAEAWTGAAVNMAVANLNNAKAEGYWVELQCMIIDLAIRDKQAQAALMQGAAAMKQADTAEKRNDIYRSFAENDAIKAKAMQLETFFKTGKEITWRSIVDASCDLANSTAKVIGSIKGGITVNAGKGAVDPNPQPMTAKEITWRELLESSRY